LIDDPNKRARMVNNWTKASGLVLLSVGVFHSPLARAVGSKGYHSQAFSEGPYPT
jgi:hypothetical protein